LIRRAIGGFGGESAASSSTESLSRRTARAAQWRLASALIAGGLQFGTGVILARLLTPTDFGIVALAFGVLGFTRSFSDLGMAGAVVQRRQLTERHVRTAFTVSILLGASIATAVVALSPIVATIMREPALRRVLPALSGVLVLQNLSVVATALLRRQLDFKRQFVVESGTFVLGYAGVAVGLALLGYGVWSLVGGALLQALLASAALLATTRHPIRPLLGAQELHDLLHFGTGSTMSVLGNYIALNGDNFVVGRWMGTASLGLYARAYNLMGLSYTYTAAVMSSVLLPAFAQLQAEPERLRRAYLLSTQLTAVVAAPFMVGLAVAAPHLVSSLYGPQWRGAVAPLQILCVAGYFRAEYHLGGVVAQSLGRVYSEFWLQAGYAALVVTGALMGLPYGLPGVAIGVTVAILAMFVAIAQLALSLTGTKWRSYARAQFPALAGGAVTCAVALVIRLLLEASEAPSTVITIAIAAGCTIPWSLGILWQLGDRGLDPLREQLPLQCRFVVDGLRRYRRGTRVA
jgi:O-antigen/teichoic acid export membrane protein